MKSRPPQHEPPARFGKAVAGAKWSPARRTLELGDDVQAARNLRHAPPLVNAAVDENTRRIAKIRTDCTAPARSPPARTVEDIVDWSLRTPSEANCRRGQATNLRTGEVEGGIASTCDPPENPLAFYDRIASMPARLENGRAGRVEPPLVPRCSRTPGLTVGGRPMAASVRSRAFGRERRSLTRSRGVTGRKVDLSKQNPGPVEAARGQGHSAIITRAVMRLVPVSRDSRVCLASGTENMAEDELAIAEHGRSTGGALILRARGLGELTLSRSRREASTCRCAATECVVKTRIFTDLGGH